MSKTESYMLENKAKRIANRLKMALEDAYKAGLVVVTVGDGNSLAIYTEEDYDNSPCVDTVYGIQSKNGSGRICPLTEISSKALKY